jgi:uncharacterized damage-inducible protein DinB
MTRELIFRWVAQMGASMTQVPIWFERKFEFTFPVEMHPNLCARLRGTPSRLEELAGGAAREVLVRKPQTDKWSAQEHVGHLLDLEPLWLARVEDFLVGGAELTAADLRNRKTDDANHNARPVAEILKEFRDARSQLVKKAEKMDPAGLGRTMLHPRLKEPMQLVDHLLFVAEHDDHHLAVVWELLQGQ